MIEIQAKNYKNIITVCIIIMTVFIIILFLNLNKRTFKYLTDIVIYIGFYY